MAKLGIRTGDRVRVLAGKDKGKEAKVLAVDPERQRVVVERVNLVKRATRATQKNPNGGLLEIEGSIHISNVALVCPKCSQPTRVGRRREDGTRIRECKKCGNDID
jgi:large subunit ribosomal protein L24